MLVGDLLRWRVNGKIRGERRARMRDRGVDVWKRYEEGAITNRLVGEVGVSLLLGPHDCTATFRDGWIYVLGKR